MLIGSASFKYLWAIMLTLAPVLSFKRKAPNETYLVPTSTGMLSTFLSVYVNFISSGRKGLVPGCAVLVETANTDNYA